MADVSNKTIIALLAIALVVTVVGTVVSVGKLNAMGGRYGVLTGAVTEGTGTATVTVSGTAALVLNSSAITIYSGYYNVSCTTGFSAINTSSTATDVNDRDVTCWLNTTGVDWANNTRRYHSLANNGTTRVNVSALITASTTTGVSTLNSTSIMCGATNCPSTSGGSDPALIQIKIADNESLSCAQGIQSTFTNLATTSGVQNVTICDRLAFEDANDEINVFFYLKIPNDVDQGEKQFTVTYYATAK